MTDTSHKAKARVLITGGSGLVGKYLTSALLARGYSVAHLSRNHDQFGRVRVYRWDPGREIIDPVVLDGIDYLIHLAGANIGEGRWSAGRRAEIFKSRVNGTLLLHRIVTDNNIPLKAFISASAIGYYGKSVTGKVYSEADPPASDFLATMCKHWEDAADQFEMSGIRTVKLRMGMILEENDSALRKLLLPARYGIVLRLGNGQQYMPWIHMSDLSAIYLRAIEDQSFTGPYNAVAPEHVTHNEFMKRYAAVTRMPLFLPHVPSFMLSALFGEMSGVVLGGSRVSADKILGTGFSFAFGNLNDALADLFGR